MLAEENAMKEHGGAVLNPQGGLETKAAPRAADVTGDAHRVVIGLIDNRKPNVAYFLDAIEENIRGLGGRDTVRVTKPRSAGPLPDLAALAARCDYVINAVAD